MAGNQEFSSPRRGRPRKAVADAVVDGSLQGVSDDHIADGQNGINADGVEAQRTAKGEVVDLERLTAALKDAESRLPHGISIVRVWSETGIQDWHGDRSDAPCEVGKAAYQVNTGKIYQI